MAYVAPASEVYLIKNCPLDIGREHTIKFASASAQQTYFQSNVRATHHWGDYVRINPLDNVIRLGLDYASVYQCNYVAFRNAATLYEQKWYYAFIVECNYINEGTTEIVYSLDYMQTYLFDFEMSPCMIEREHTKTDNVGENIVPEGLDIGEYVLNKSHKSGGGTVMNPNGYIPCHIGDDIIYIVITTQDFTDRYTHQTPQYNEISTFYPVGRLYNGVGVFVIQDTTTLAAILTDYSGRTDSIAAVFPFPSALIEWDCVHWCTPLSPWSSYKFGRLYDDNGKYSVRVTKLDDSVSYTDSASTVHTPHSAFQIPRFRSEAIDGYTPWNNKMYSAPFCWIELDSKTGETALYRPEFFGTIINFGFMASPNAEPQIFAYPVNYRNMTSNYEEGITKTGAYPYCPYQNDVYKEWLQKNGASIATSFALGIINASSGMAASAVGRTVVSDITRSTKGKIPQYQPARDAKGRYTPGKGSYVYKDYDKTTQEHKATQYLKDPAEGVMNGINGFGSCLSTLASIAEHSLVPNQVSGQVNNGSINQANGVNDFYVYIKTVRSDYAQKIDDFFSRYGYAVNKFGIPNVLDTNGVPRRRWNYVKTVDCKVHGKGTVGFNHDVEENLEEIFDNGVTFWNLANGDMYDYSQTAQNNNKPSA